MLCKVVLLNVISSLWMKFTWSVTIIQMELKLLFPLVLFIMLYTKEAAILTFVFVDESITFDHESE